MIRALLLVTLGAASFAAVYVVMQPGASDSRPPLSEPAPVAAEPAAVDPEPMALQLRPGAQAYAEVQSQSAVRDVTPANMTAGPSITGPLTRVVAAEPEAVTPREARRQRLYNPLIMSAGTIKLKDREIRFAGIDAPAFDLRCGKGAAAWPCGRMARAALRRFIRGRAIECEVPAGADAVPATARCAVAGEDIAAWLVAQGWARKTAEAYSDAEAAAREARVGLWSDRRPDQAAEIASRD